MAREVLVDVSSPGSTPRSPSCEAQSAVQITPPGKTAGTTTFPSWRYAACSTATTRTMTTRPRRTSHVAATATASGAGDPMFHVKHRRAPARPAHALAWAVSRETSRASAVRPAHALEVARGPFDVKHRGEAPLDGPAHALCARRIVHVNIGGSAARAGPCARGATSAVHVNIAERAFASPTVHSRCPHGPFHFKHHGEPPARPAMHSKNHAGRLT